MITPDGCVFATAFTLKFPYLSATMRCLCCGAPAMVFTPEGNGVQTGYTEPGFGGVYCRNCELAVRESKDGEKVMDYWHRLFHGEDVHNTKTAQPHVQRFAEKVINRANVLTFREQNRRRPWGQGEVGSE